MNPYRKKFLEDMKLKGFAESTQNTYLREVKRFFNRCHPGKAPEKITEEDLRNYFLHLKNDRNHSVAGIKAALWGLRFFLRTSWRTIGPSLI